MGNMFRWTMRHGAKLLLVVALLQLIGALLVPLALFLSETAHMAADFNYAPGNDSAWLVQLSQLLYSLANVAIPLLGALLIDRADRWLAIRERPEAQQ
jgi:hypothetical protein